MRLISIMQLLILALFLSTTLFTSRAWCGDANTTTVRRTAFEWMYHHAKFETPQMSQQVRDLFANAFDEERDFVATFGEERTRTGQPCQICLFAGRLFVCDLTHAQATAVLSEQTAITFSSGKRRYKIQPERVELSGVKLVNCDRQAINKKIAGEVSYRCLSELPADLMLRISYRYENNGVQKFYPLSTALTQKEGTLKFEFPAIHNPSDTDSQVTPGPLAVFLDICSLTDENGGEFSISKALNVNVYSNPVPAMLDITAPEIQRVSVGDNRVNSASPFAIGNAAMGSIEGTLWQFEGTKTSVEFLSDGKFRWNGEEETGAWTQVGNKVTLNVNDYTIFRFTLVGDKLVGGWERLKGEEAGVKCPSTLKRVIE